MGGPVLSSEEWDKVEVPAVEDVAAQAAVEGKDVDSALSESFDSAAEVAPDTVETVKAAAVPVAPAPTL